MNFKIRAALSFKKWTRREKRILNVTDRMNAETNFNSFGIYMDGFWKTIACIGQNSLSAFSIVLEL